MVLIDISYVYESIEISVILFVFDVDNVIEFEVINLIEIMFDK